MVGRGLQLHVTASAEVDILTLRQAQGQLLDEGGHIGVGLDGALPLLDPKDILGDIDGHVLLDRHLARQAPAFLGLAAIEVRLFGGQHGATPLLDDAFALGAAAAATAG